MATITIDDLPQNRAMDYRAMSAIRGGGAPWVFGWIRPYAPAVRGGIPPVVNLYQINNSFYAEQMINQFQVVDVRNSGPNSNINLALEERSSNFRF